MKLNFKSIKKLIPVPMIFGRGYVRCPTCDTIHLTESPFFMERKKKCPVCGQRVTWRAYENLIRNRPTL